MSRSLWALLGGVVLLAIAGVFWTASNQTNVTPPVSPSPTPVAPAPVAQEPAPSSAPVPAPTAQKAVPSPPSSPPPPAAQEAAAPSVPAPTAPPAPTPAPAPDARQQAASPPAPAPASETPSAPPVVAQQPSPPPAPAPLADAPPPAPGREAPEVQGEHAPKSLAQLVGAWAYSPEDCERLFERRGGGWAYRQPVDKFAQAAIVESPKRILLPSATCQVERASEAEGALKVSAECADSISYTSRSTVITLRSATELVYSASGDSALATTLKKCAP
jgi:hypothetical protein